MPFVAMATIKIEIWNIRRPMKWQWIELALQPGIIHTFIPTPMLNRLGVQPFIEEKFRMPDGSVVKRRKGVVKFRYQKQIGASSVIFGRPGDPTVIGQLGLASVGLDLDRKTGELKLLRKILA